MDKPSSHSMPHEDTTLVADALAYATELYREMSHENGAPTLGTQNQLVEFILADQGLTDAVRRWAAGRDTGEATMRPPERLPRDELWRRCREKLGASMETPVFVDRARRGR